MRMLQTCGRCASPLPVNWTQVGDRGTGVEVLARGLPPLFHSWRIVSRLVLPRTVDRTGAEWRASLTLRYAQQASVLLQGIFHVEVPVIPGMTARMLQILVRDSVLCQEPVELPVLR